MAANDDLKELAEQFMKDKLVLRSKKIQEFLHEKRNLTAYQNVKKDRPLFHPGRKGRNDKETRSSSENRSYGPVQALKEIQKRQEMLDM